MNYNNKKIKSIQKSKNGKVTDELVFTYKQTGNILTYQYLDEKIGKRQLFTTIKIKQLCEKKLLISEVRFFKKDNT